MVIVQVVVVFFLMCLLVVLWCLLGFAIFSPIHRTPKGLPDGVSIERELALVCNVELVIVRGRWR